VTAKIESVELVTSTESWKQRIEILPAASYSVQQQQRWATGRTLRQIELAAVDFDQSFSHGDTHFNVKLRNQENPTLCLSPVVA
jgi:hypothetical protein